MAKGGEVRALDEMGRSFPSLLAFTTWPGLARQHAAFGLTPPQDTEGVAEVAPLMARIYADSWIVDCPDCGGAEFVWLNGPFLMWCHSCGNVAVNGMWRRVELPGDIAAAEALLDKRTLRDQRNWDPRIETIEMLRAENAEKGDPL